MHLPMFRVVLLSRCIAGRRAFQVLSSWVELSCIALVVLGFALGFVIRNLIVSYSTLFLFGLVAGVLYYKNRDRGSLFIVLACFLAGYLIGNRVADVYILAGLFVAGIFMAYQALSRRLVKII